MTLGDKLTKLRKENNYTQEQLADILNVSRQSISRWELGIAYPETDKLIKLGELYGCSMDYLLMDDLSEVHSTAATPHKFNLKSLYFERKSTTTIRGVPLWHINIGLGRTANGIIAIGLVSKGIISVGVVSLGIVSLGVFAIGLLALGTLALGLLSLGAITVGVIALGAISVGCLSIGALAIGQFSVGALSVGQYLAIGDNAQAAIAIGKTEAIGTLFEANAITPENRQTVINLLDTNVPTVFKWLAELAKLFI